MASERKGGGEGVGPKRRSNIRNLLEETAWSGYSEETLFLPNIPRESKTREDAQL